ncbi:hypothetical protein ABK040_000395 [Willaertia magna]
MKEKHQKSVNHENSKETNNNNNKDKNNSSSKNLSPSSPTTHKSSFFNFFNKFKKNNNSDVDKQQQLAKKDSFSSNNSPSSPIATENNSSTPEVVIPKRASLRIRNFALPLSEINNNNHSNSPRGTGNNSYIENNNNLYSASSSSFSHQHSFSNLSSEVYNNNTMSSPRVNPIRRAFQRLTIGNLNDDPNHPSNMNAATDPNTFNSINTNPSILEKTLESQSQPSTSSTPMINSNLLRLNLNNLNNYDSSSLNNNINSTDDDDDYFFDDTYQLVMNSDIGRELFFHFIVKNFLKNEQFEFLQEVLDRYQNNAIQYAYILDKEGHVTVVHNNNSNTMNNTTKANNNVNNNLTSNNSVQNNSIIGEGLMAGGVTNSSSVQNSNLIGTSVREVEKQQRRESIISENNDSTDNNNNMNENHNNHIRTNSGSNNNGVITPTSTTTPTTITSPSIPHGLLNIQPKGFTKADVDYLIEKYIRENSPNELNITQKQRTKVLQQWEKLQIEKNFHIKNNLLTEHNNSEENITESSGFTNSSNVVHWVNENDFIEIFRELMNIISYQLKTECFNEFKRSEWYLDFILSERKGISGVSQVLKDKSRFSWQNVQNNITNNDGRQPLSSRRKSFFGLRNRSSLNASNNNNDTASTSSSKSPSSTDGSQTPRTPRHSFSFFHKDNNNDGSQTQRKGRNPFDFLAKMILISDNNSDPNQPPLSTPRSMMNAGISPHSSSFRNSSKVTN